MSAAPQTRFRSLTVLLISRLTELDLRWVYGVGPPVRASSSTASS